MSDGPTRAQLEARLDSLKRELATGQQMAANLDQQRVNLEQNMLRISGAIQLLEELLDGQGAGTTEPAAEQTGA